jgi:hypothetical protein
MKKGRDFEGLVGGAHPDMVDWWKKHRLFFASKSTALMRVATRVGF